MGNCFWLYIWWFPLVILHMIFFFSSCVLTWPALMKFYYSLYKMVISGAEPAAIIPTPWPWLYQLMAATGSRPSKTIKNNLIVRWNNETREELGSISVSLLNSHPKAQLADHCFCWRWACLYSHCVSNFKRIKDWDAILPLTFPLPI